MTKLTVSILDMLDERGAAQYIGLEPQTLSVWRSTKRYNLSYYKVGSKVRYAREDLDAWLASRKVVSGGNGGNGHSAKAKA